MKLKNIIKIGSFVVAGTLPTTSNAQVYMCQACPAGTYSDGTQTQCTPCPAGTYSNGGASECKACPAGKYSKAGSSECQTCGAGTYSTAGAGSCSSCSQPTYSGWSSGSCGVTATRTKTTYCNASGNTSATANPSNSTESKYNGDCPKCKVRVWHHCKCYQSSGTMSYCGSIAMGCGEPTTSSKVYYINIGESVRGVNGKSYTQYTRTETSNYEVIMTDGTKCYSSGDFGYFKKPPICTCR